MRAPNKLKAIDFFSGAGGLTYGLRRARINVIAGIDNDPSCKETYEINNKGVAFFQRDISKYSPKDLARDLKARGLKISKNDDAMIFAGCAPCQYWSAIRTEKSKAEKTKNLILEFQRLVRHFKPGFVVVENVPRIASNPQSPLSKFIKSLESFGYKVAQGITDMSAYGVPQNRRRFTLLASRLGPISLPKPTGKTKTVRDVLGAKNGFAKIRAGHNDPTDFMHTSPDLRDKNLQRLRLTKKDGGDRAAWQKIKSLGLRCYASGERKFYDTYGRMWWDKPAPTITTKFFSISNGRFAHPAEDRAISLREGATLQTFPRHYKFAGAGIERRARMIGNAVPPAFAEIIGKHIISSIPRR